MDEKNKKRWSFDLKCIGLVFWGVLTAATMAGVLNYCPETIVKVGAVILAVINAIVIYKIGKKLNKSIGL